MVVSFIMLLQALLLSITRLQVFHRYARAQLINRNDPSVVWQTEQSGLLCIDDGFLAADCDLKCPHLRCLQSEPQSQLALAKRILGLLRWVTSMTVPIERTACRALVVSQ